MPKAVAGPWSARAGCGYEYPVLPAQLCCDGHGLMSQPAGVKYATKLKPKALSGSEQKAESVKTAYDADNAILGAHSYGFHTVLPGTLKF